MKHLKIFVLLLFSPLLLFADQLDPITVYKKVHKFRQDFTLEYGFSKGDLVIFKYKETSDNNIREIKITTADGDKLLYHIDDKPSQSMFQYQMKEDNVLTFYIRGIELINREPDMEILRIPASPATVHFNRQAYTFIEKYQINLHTKQL